MAEAFPGITPAPIIEVTFKDFQKLMLKRKRTVDDLVDIFRGKLELAGNSELGANDNSRSFFERVMSCQWRNPETGRYEDRGSVVIPYPNVIEYYAEELHYFKDTAPKKQRLCACGCGKPVFGRPQYASAACKKRAYRERLDAKPYQWGDEKVRDLPISGKMEPITP